MATSKPHSELEQRLIVHIDRYGPITFQALMEAALYDRDHGYYPNTRRQSIATGIGTDGDYFTSPSAHPVFGALVALQLREMWQIMGSPHEFNVVEMGAGDGKLASDISAYVENQLPDFAESMQYLATDLVPPTTSDALVKGISALPAGISGCVLSNELLDSHPVNRFIVAGGTVKEILIDYQDGAFKELVRDITNPEIEARILPFLPSLPERYEGEVNLGLGYWADSVAATLSRGYLLTIDYGYDRPDLYSPTRNSGSLRCYYQHTLGQNPLHRIGKQDITAHVDFTAVDHMLAVNNFERYGWTSQAKFLTNLGIEDFIGDVGIRSSNHEISRSELEEEMAGMGILIDPKGMGRFRVAVHSRDIDNTGGNSGPLTGITGGKTLAMGHKPPSIETSSVHHSRPLRVANPFNHPEPVDLSAWDQLFSDEP